MICTCSTYCLSKGLCLFFFLDCLLTTCREHTYWISFIIISQGFKSGVIDESHCHYMVVFQYGSIVLFNVSDHEADGYLKIVEKHASGLLPEMRKDGKPRTLVLKE